MPLTFAEAKLRYNPDPAWEPKRNSSEYNEIIQMMKNSGATFHAPANKPLEVSDVYKNGEFKHPIENRKAPVEKKFLSKKDFLSIKPNYEKFIKHLAPKTNTVVEVPQIIINKATLCALKTKAQCVMDEQNRIKRMSKKEFLTMEDNREYMRQHILLNKK
jgi:hypothetical protein